MASFVILIPETGPGEDQEKTRLIRDGFSLGAFFFPAIWLMLNRFWLLGCGALLLQGLGLAFLQAQGLWPAGFALLLSVSVLTAVEGRGWLVRSLLSRGFVATGLVSAHNLAEAEEVHFSAVESAMPKDIHPADWDIRRGNVGKAHGGAALGLIGYDGGR